MTNWRKTQGSQKEKPTEFDTTSSTVTVYQRKNIERITTKDEASGEPYEMWEYDERQMSREEYDRLRSEQMHADIVYIGIMSGIEM